LNQKQQHAQAPRCTLKWRQGQLLVNLAQQVEQLHLPALENEQWLIKCLRHSPVRLLRIDPALGEAGLQFWAEACEQANKEVFLRLHPAYRLPRKRGAQSWWLERLVDWSIAALLLLLLSPVMLGLVCLMRIQSPEPIFFRQWCVGERGKIFQLLNFRTSLKHDVNLMVHQKSLRNRKDDQSITSLGQWMRNYSLDKLPQLFNVLRGEVSLRGARPWTLCDAVRLNFEE
jgi:lipopolysaccharide/colanic/teichoic acid biosynthesis glycosyltransferase